MNTCSTQPNKDAKVYRSYVESKNNKQPVDVVCKEFGITRTAVYDAVNRVKNGNHTMIRRCLEKARNECVWEHKYKARWLALPKDKRPQTVEETRSIIKSMFNDEHMPKTFIAKKLEINRSSVDYHLEK